MGVQDRDWYWQDRDTKNRATYNLRDFRGRRVFLPRGHSSATRWLAGVCVAALIYVLGFAFVQWRTQTMAEQISRNGQDAQLRMQQQAQQAQRDEAARQDRRQALLQQQEAMRLQSIAERQRGEEDARRAATNAVDRKAKAWAKFYRKPATCEDAATMECANAFIRAKRTFEEKYARGEL